jgi:hypothetical protein
MLAIIIPYFKLTYFEATLQSLAVQTNKDFKVYIGDDASPEDCSKVIEKFNGHFDFLYKRFETNLGSTSLAKQWERCISLIEDEKWIMILGDDDELDVSVVSSFYKNLAVFNGKSNLIRFATQLIFEETKQKSKKYSHPQWESATDSFFRKYDATSRSSLSEYIFNKEVYFKYGFYDYPLAWSSDDRAWLEFSDGKPIFSINESLVFIRVSSINISGKNDNSELKNLSEIIFFRYIISNKLTYYHSNQKLRLLKNYKKKIKVYRNLTLQEYFFIFYYYIKNLNYKWIKIAIKSLIGKVKNQ